MIKEVHARHLKPGDRVAGPFRDPFTVKQVVLGHKYAHVQWVELRHTTKYGVNDPVLLEVEES